MSITQASTGMQFSGRGLSAKGRTAVFYCLLFFLPALFATRANAAEVYFNHVYKGIGSAYDVETNSIQISAATLLTGTNFRFHHLIPRILPILAITFRGISSTPIRQG